MDVSAHDVDPRRVARLPCSFPPPVVGVSSNDDCTLGHIEEVEFRWNGSPGDDVELCGSWNPRRPVRVPETNGTYSVVIVLTPGMYEFHFHVNGVQSVSDEYHVNGNRGTEENNIRVVAVGLSPESAEDARLEREHRIRQRLYCLTQLRGSKMIDISDTERSSSGNDVHGEADPMPPTQPSKDGVALVGSNDVMPAEGCVRRWHTTNRPAGHEDPASMASSMTSSTSSMRQAAVNRRGAPEKQAKQDEREIRKSLLFTFVDKGEFQPLPPPKLEAVIPEELKAKQRVRKSLFDGLLEKINFQDSVDLTTSPFIASKENNIEKPKARTPVHPATVVKLSSLVVSSRMRASVEFMDEQAARLRNRRDQKHGMRRWFNGAFERIKTSMRTGRSSRRHVM
mmetsp:Transcript_5307/g.15851  ORF Transcript_5307/g.15851 Transcript_5307/m.15851 type:complete len:396 (+) Transcript_5307:424-1611(+)